MWFEFSTGLKRETMLSSTPSPNVRVVQHVLDVKAWILPQMNELHGHSTPHCFKFIKKCGSDDVLMYCKHLSSDPWYSEAEATIPLKVRISYYCDSSMVYTHALYNMC